MPGFDTLPEQLVFPPSREIMSDAERARRNKELVQSAVDEYIVAAGVAIQTREPDGSTRTFREGDPLRRGIDILSNSKFEALLKHHDVLKISKDQLMINRDDPDARYIVNPSGRAITIRGTIHNPGSVFGARNCARPPEPEQRDFRNGRWLEAGEIYPGDDGTAKLEELIAKGYVIDRKLIDKVKTAAKRVLSKATGGKAAE